MREYYFWSKTVRGAPPIWILSVKLLVNYSPFGDIIFDAPFENI